jgi:DNA topoisomerase-2
MYRVFDNLEAMLNRPEVFIGDMSKVTKRELVFTVAAKPTTGDTTDDTEDKKTLASAISGVEMRDVTYCPAFLKVFDEVFSNACDCQFRDPTLTEVDVTVDAESGRITVRNNGIGIPVATMEFKEGKKRVEAYIPTVIFSRFNSGSNFNDSEDTKRFTGGRFGLGVKLTNAMSTTLSLRVGDAKRKLVFSQQFSNNMRTIIEPVIKSYKAAKFRPGRKKGASGFCEVSFVLDFARFGMAGLDEDAVRMVTKYVVEARATLHSRIKVTLNGTVIPCASLSEFSALVFGHASGDMSTTVPTAESTAESKGDEEVSEAVPPLVVSCRTKEPTSGLALYDFVISARADDHGSGHMRDMDSTWGFVNSIVCHNGRHVQIVYNTLRAALISRAKGRRDIPVKVVAFMERGMCLRDVLNLCIRALVSKPTFAGQLKNYLTTPRSSIPELGAWKPSSKVLDRILDDFGLLGRMSEEADVNTLRDAQRSQRASKSAHSVSSIRRGILNIDGYGRALQSHRPTSTSCSLFVTEGKSASALAIAGLAVVGRDFYGVFALRGKLLNVRNTSVTDALTNTEIAAMVSILGLQVGKTYTSLRSLPYKKLVIFTDQDPDGSHIGGLILNFVEVLFPSLLAVDPTFIQRFVTPLIKVSKKGSTSVVKTFFSMPKFDTWRATATGVRLIASAGTTVKYFKGLGTSSNKEAREYFRNMSSHVVDFSFAPTDSTLLDDMFNSRKAAVRREMLSSTYVPGAVVEYVGRQGAVPVREYIEREMLSYSCYDNSRSIVNAIDGLKTSQRKAMFTFFTSSTPTKEVKVAQIGAEIAQRTAYHHGETSMFETVISLAQRHVGTNNINLLVPHGQFGTRLNKPSEHGAPRYIHTSLDPIARFIFPAADDAVLQYNSDDGRSIEPTYYVPIVPWILVNGAFGIGTGWMVSMPSFDPMLVASIIYNRVVEMALPALHTRPVWLVTTATTWDASSIAPWFSGFSGDVALPQRADGKYSYSTSGRVEQIDERTLHVTELPVATWKDTFDKHVVEKLMAKSRNELRNAHEVSKKAKPTKAKKAKFAYERFVLYPESRSTDTKVDVTLVCDPDALVRAKAAPGGLDRQLRLTTTNTKNNINAFDTTGTLVHFESPQGIIDMFMPIRRALYEKRKEARVAALGKTITKLSSTIRFLVDVMDGAVVVHRKTRAVLRAEMRDRGYAEIDGGHDYLLRLPFWSTTAERIAEHRATIAATTEKLEMLERTAIESIWMSELNSFADAYAKFVVRRKDAMDAEEKDNAKDNASKPLKRKRAPTTAVKRMKKRV